MAEGTGSAAGINKPSFANALGWSGLGICRLLQRSVDRLQQKLGIKGGECTPDGKFSLDACRCVGACGLAPVMTINDDVYGRLTGDELDEILAKY